MQHQDIYDWIQKRLIKKEQINLALNLAGKQPNKNQWRVFLSTIFLFFGILALATALIFFFAFNWDAMSRFMKFSLVQLGLVLSLLLYWRLGAWILIRHGLVLLIALLIGAWLALTGQTYQTGADTWQLFFSWALLITPMVLWQKVESLWLFWIILWNLTLILYQETNSRFFGFIFSTNNWLYTGLILNVFFVIVLEWLNTERAPNWLKLSSRWVVLCWLLFTFSILLLTGFHALFDNQHQSLSSLLFLIGMAISWWYYRQVSLDVIAMVFWCLTMIIFLTAFLGKILFESDIEAGGFLVLGLALIGMAVGASKWLLSLRQGGHKQ